MGTIVVEPMTMGRPLVGPNHGRADVIMDHKNQTLKIELGNTQSLTQVIG